MKASTKILVGLGVAIGGFFILRRYFPQILKLPAQAGQAISTAVIEKLQPTGVYNTAAAASSAYQQAVNAIIKANPQYTPALVQKFLINAQWHLGDKLPAYLRAP